MNTDDRLVEVRYQIDAANYLDRGEKYSAFEDQKARTAFYREADDIFLGLGWSVLGQTNVRMGDSCLYIHLQEIFGTVRTWEVDYIADNMRGAETFSVCNIIKEGAA